MKKLTALIVGLFFLCAGAAFAQHRKGDTPPPNQPPQQAQPRDGGEKAKPREAPRDGRDGRDGRGDRRGPGQIVVVPDSGWPWGYPYPPGYPPYGYRVFTDWATSNVHLDVEPDDAQVFVDRFYAGVVDDFNGFFQRLTLQPGPHLIEIRKPGYRSLAFELNLYPDQTVTYRQRMEPSQDDDEAAGVAPIAPAFEEGAELPPVAIDAPPGDLKFDVTPKEAAIYADGFYVGIVDDFNGSQHMRLTQGRHHLELRLEGYESIDVDLTIDSEKTITYRATLRPIAR